MRHQTLALCISLRAASLDATSDAERRASRHASRVSVASALDGIHEGRAQFVVMRCPSANEIGGRTTDPSMLAPCNVVMVVHHGRHAEPPWHLGLHEGIP